MNIIWKPRAGKKAARIKKDYNKVAPGSGDNFVRGLEEILEPLGRFPRSGRKARGFGSDLIREKIYKNYRITYYINEDKRQIEIMYLRHTRQNI